MVKIPCSGEAGTRVEPLAILPSQELVVIRSSHDIAMAGSSNGLGMACKLVWPYLVTQGRLGSSFAMRRR